MGRNNRRPGQQNKLDLAAKKTAVSKAGDGFVSQIVAATISRVRQDVTTWNAALTMARKAENPKRHLLHNLYDEIEMDALLTSQVQNRFLKSLASAFMITDKAGKLNEEATAKLQNKIFVDEINKAILARRTRAHSLGEFSWIERTISQATAEPELKFTIFKRQNIEPRDGRFYPDYREDKFIEYRTLKEYGTWIIEFGNDDLGLLNSAVPHVLFKRFAQSCWSELCEIAGIPPRVLKTDTQNPAMMRRAERMMKDMGAAAWMIINDNESFEWAEATKTDGTVYNNLMTFCNNELSLLISGSVKGQDTKNGSRSKEDSMQETLQTLVDSDLSLLEQDWNATVIPALINIGYLSGDLVFKFPKAEDLEQLWTMVKDSMQSYEYDVNWLNDTFGLKIIKAKEAQPAQTLSLNHGESFFV